MTRLKDDKCCGLCGRQEYGRITYSSDGHSLFHMLRKKCRSSYCRTFVFGFVTWSLVTDYYVPSTRLCGVKGN